MRRMRNLSIVAALAALVGLGGCSGDDGSDKTTPDVVENEDVVEDEDVPASGDVSLECEPACTAGFTCVEGQCVENAPPACEPACTEGFTCIEGQCVEDEPTACEPACGEGFECIDSLCVEKQPPACEPACGAGFTCVEGQCVEDEPLVCEPACEAGFECIEGTCVQIPQGECELEGNVKNLKGCIEGPVDVTIQGATVTYVFAQGYFIQDASGGMEVYVGDEWAYDVPQVDQIIDIHVTEYGNFNNQQEVVTSDAPVVTGTGDAAALKVDLSDGTLPSEDTESKLVMIKGITATAMDGKNVTASYGTATDVVVRLDTPELVCPGATFDLMTAIVTHFKTDHRIQSFHAADIANVDTEGCKPVGDADDSNWGFEEAGPADPPADFEKMGSDFTAQTTDESFHGGAQSCKLTWTSTENQDFFQGMYQAVTVGQTVTFKVWAMDNDTAGRIRINVEFYNVNYLSLKKEYGGYTSDNAEWTEMTHEIAAPDGAAFARAFVRLYDVSENWDNDASVFIDDWSVGIQ
jgi:hypothetical protein